jgi:hypothetical protein
MKNRHRLSNPRAKILRHPLETHQAISIQGTLPTMKNISTRLPKQRLGTKKQPARTSNEVRMVFEIHFNFIRSFLRRNSLSIMLLS